VFATRSPGRPSDEGDALAAEIGEPHRFSGEIREDEVGERFPGSDGKLRCLGEQEGN
jgi:hypothetical protein